MGYNVIKAFYAQHQLESLRAENEILEELLQAGSGKPSRNCGMFWLLPVLG